MASPRNFSWFVEGKLAGMGYPVSDNIPFLAQEGIRTLVNLTTVASHPSTYEEGARAHGMAVHSIDIQDFTPPTMEQIEEFLRIVENTESVMGTHTLPNKIESCT
jgi:atypical dual specificity phosphatase